MFFCKSPNCNLYLPPQIDNKFIPEVYNTKFLGVYLDHKLLWNIHIDYIISKISKITGIIYLSRNDLTKDALMTVYYSLIYSNIIYCISIWGNTLKKFTKQVLSAQKRAIRALSFLNRMESMSGKMMELKLLKLNNIYTYFCSLLIFRSRNSGYCNGIFSRLNHNHGTRGRTHDMIVPVIRNSLFSNSVIYNPPKIWNRLPIELKNMSNIVSFKIRLKKYLLQIQAPQ